MDGLMLIKLSLLFHTVIHLKWVQLYYQLFYKLRNKVLKAHSFASLKGYKAIKTTLQLVEHPFVAGSSSIAVTNNGLEFTFLNLSQTFPVKSIDWNYEGEGKLWNYNLNYFDFLQDSSVSRKDRLELISQYCESFDSLSGGLEPYPISLRGINWIKYLSVNKIRDRSIDECLYKQYKILFSNLEYHILANHLLENAFSVFHAAYYFQNESFYRQAQKLLKEQLKEQILEDGGHFERSPMYHQIILFRLLDTINLVKNNSWKSHQSFDFFVEYAQIMLAWMENVSFKNGEIPMTKDAASGIAPNGKQLIEYARALGLTDIKINKTLSFSGYRKFETNNLEVLMDIGEITPSYQPGHAHADELNFLLNVQGRPIIVDTGISTYEKNDRRQLERSTSSHNCVYFTDQNSSDVWGGFRVAKRAKVNVKEDSETTVIAKHDGYAKLGALIERKFELRDGAVSIEDTIESNSLDPRMANLNLHFHPNVEVRLSGNELFVDNLHLILTGFHGITVENYMFANGFNNLKKAQRLNLKMSKETRILISHVS